VYVAAAVARQVRSVVWDSIRVADAKIEKKQANPNFLCQKSTLSSFSLFFARNFDELLTF
jgi:hypothetical protein